MNDFNLLTRKLMTRQGFLGLVSVSVAGLAGLAVGLPILGYLIGPLVNPPKKVWRNVNLVNGDGTAGKVVKVDTIPLGLTKKVSYLNPRQDSWSGTLAHDASWLRRTGTEEFIAFSDNCTHLGCPVNWLEEGKLFLCPCHGSVFNGDGTVASGPAARPLVHYPVRVRRGHVQIKTEPLPLVF